MHPIPDITHTISARQNQGLLTIGLRFGAFPAHFRRNARRNGGTGRRAGDRMDADRAVPADAMWARVGPMPPGRATDPGATAADSRRFVEAVPWRFRTGRRRQGVRRGLAARGGGDPGGAEPDGAPGARPGDVRVAAPGREPLRQNQGVPGGGDALRQDGRGLRGGDPSRRRRGGGNMTVNRPWKG